MNSSEMRAVEVDGEYIMIDEATNTGTKMPAMGMGSNKHCQWGLGYTIINLALPST